MIYVGQSLVALDERVAHITWADITDGTVKAYNLYMQENGGAIGKIDETTGTEWFSPPLRWDAEYTFYVTSTNHGDIESDLVNPIVFKLQDSKPETFTVPESLGDVDITTTTFTKDISSYGKGSLIKFEVEL